MSRVRFLSTPRRMRRRATAVVAGYPVRAPPGGARRRWTAARARDRDGPHRPRRPAAPTPRRRRSPRAANRPEYGLVAVDDTLPERDRYLVAMSSAVQLSGLAERIGMAQSTQVVQTKMLDYFFSLRKLHRIAFQPIVQLAHGELYEYECLFRPEMPMLPQSIGSVVQAAINTDRGVELDVYIVATVLEQHRPPRGRRPARRHRAAPVRDQPDAASASSHPAFEAAALAPRSAAPGSTRARSRSSAPSSSRSPTSARSSARSRPCARSASGSRSTTPAPATRASR